MRALAPFAYFYHLSPAEFWGLELREFNALAKFMDEYNREMERANR